MKESMQSLSKHSTAQRECPARDSEKPSSVQQMQESENHVEGKRGRQGAMSRASSLAYMTMIGFLLRDMAFKIHAFS